MFFEKAAAVKKQLSCIGGEAGPCGGHLGNDCQTTYKLKDRHKSKEQMKRQEEEGCQRVKGRSGKVKEK